MKEAYLSGTMVFFCPKTDPTIRQEKKISSSFFIQVSSEIGFGKNSLTNLKIFKPKTRNLSLILFYGIVRKYW
jgi:hypothetical protein